MKDIDNILEQVRKAYVDGSDYKNVIDTLTNAFEKRNNSVSSFIESLKKSKLFLNYEDEIANIKNISNNYFETYDFESLHTHLKSYLKKIDKNSLDYLKFSTILFAMTGDRASFYKGLLSYNILLSRTDQNKSDNIAFGENFVLISKVINSCLNNGVSEDEIKKIYQYYMTTKDYSNQVSSNDKRNGVLQNNPVPKTRKVVKVEVKNTPKIKPDMKGNDKIATSDKPVNDFSSSKKNNLDKKKSTSFDDALAQFLNDNPDVKERASSSNTSTPKSNDSALDSVLSERSNSEPKSPSDFDSKGTIKWTGSVFGSDPDSFQLVRNPNVDKKFVSKEEFDKIGAEHVDSFSEIFDKAMAKREASRKAHNIKQKTFVIKGILRKIKRKVDKAKLERAQAIIAETYIAKFNQQDEERINRSR